MALSSHLRSWGFDSLLCSMCSFHVLPVSLGFPAAVQRHAFRLISISRLPVLCNVCALKRTGIPYRVYPRSQLLLLGLGSVGMLTQWCHGESGRDLGVSIGVAAVVWWRLALCLFCRAPCREILLWYLSHLDPPDALGCLRRLSGPGSVLAPGFEFAPGSEGGAKFTQKTTDRYDVTHLDREYWLV